MVSQTLIFLIPVKKIEGNFLHLKCDNFCRTTLPRMKPRNSIPINSNILMNARNKYFQNNLHYPEFRPKIAFNIEFGSRQNISLPQFKGAKLILKNNLTMNWTRTFSIYFPKILSNFLHVPFKHLLNSFEDGF